MNSFINILLGISLFIFFDDCSRCGSAKDQNTPIIKVGDRIQNKFGNTIRIIGIRSLPGDRKRIDYIIEGVNTLGSGDEETIISTYVRHVED